LAGAALGRGEACAVCVLVRLWVLLWLLLERRGACVCRWCVAFVEWLRRWWRTAASTGWMNADPIMKNAAINESATKTFFIRPPSIAL
jgi:hypothetical protein